MSSRSSRSVVVATQGGIGNQLFQLAAGHVLAARLSATLHVDDAAARGRSSVTLRTGAAATSLTSTDRLALRSMRKRELPVSRILGTTYVNELECGPPIDIPDSRRIVMKGYFQSAHYYDDLSTFGRAARAEFGQHVAESLRDRLSIGRATIGVHVRRGDYLHGPAAKELGFVGTDYYRNALHQLTTDSHAHVIGFSDDPNYFASTDLGVPITDASNCTDVETLMALASCSALVLSNSSLSWWAARLSQCRPDHVIVPSPWSRTNPWISPADPSWTWMPRTDDVEAA